MDCKLTDCWNISDNMSDLKSGHVKIFIRRGGRGKVVEIILRIIGPIIGFGLIPGLSILTGEATLDTKGKIITACILFALILFLWIKGVQVGIRENMDYLLEIDQEKLVINGNEQLRLQDIKYIVYRKMNSGGSSVHYEVGFKTKSKRIIVGYELKESEAHKLCLNLSHFLKKEVKIKRGVYFFGIG